MNMNAKTFFVKLLIFAILFVVADQLCGLGFRYLNSTAGDKFAREEYIRHKMDAEVVLLGSSRCAHHYVPRILQDSLGLTVYNCGQRGNGIIYEYGRLSTILKRYTPKILIVDFVQGYDIEVNDNNRYLDFLKCDYGKNAVVDSIFWNCDKFSKYKMLFQSYRYNSTICDLMLNILLKNRGRFDSYGFSALHGFKKENVEFEYFDKHFEIDSLKLYYIKRLAMEKNNGMDIIFTMSPSFAGENIGFSNLIKSIADEYNIPFLNFNYTEGISGNGEMYSNDGSHLNEEGAIQFTSILAGDLKSMYNR